MIKKDARTRSKPRNPPPWPPRAKNRQRARRPRARKPKADPMMDYLRQQEILELGDIGFGADELDALLAGARALDGT